MVSNGHVATDDRRGDRQALVSALPGCRPWRFPPPLGGVGIPISGAAAHRCVRLLDFPSVQNGEEFFMA